MIQPFGGVPTEREIALLGTYVDKPDPLPVAEQFKSRTQSR